MSGSFADSYSRLILSRPAITLLIITMLFIGMAYCTQYFRLDASADSLLLENDQDLRIFRDLNERYDIREFLFVAFSPDAELFSQASLDVIAELRRELGQLEQVESVVSLLDVPLVKVVGGRLADVAANYRTLDDTEVDRDKARQELLSSPIFRDLIISADGKTTALVINLPPQAEYFRLLNRKNYLQMERNLNGLDAEQTRELKTVLHDYRVVKQQIDKQNHLNIEQIRAVIDRYQSAGKFYLGGVPMVVDDMVTFIKNDLAVFGIGVFVFLVLMLLIIFRQTRFVLLPLLSCIFAVTVMLGILGLVGWPVTVISSNFISLMLILTMSMNIHLIVRYRQLRRDFPEMEQKQLVLEATRKMVMPCFYTALTTMIGFGSLVVSDIKPVIDFGWMMTMGLMVVFLTSFIVFPSVLVMFDKTVKANISEEVPFTAVLARATETHGNKILLLALLLALFSAYGITRLKVENSFINYFSKDTEIYQGLKLVDEQLGGTTPLDIILNFDSEQSSFETDTAATSDADDEFSDIDELFDSFEEQPVDPADAWFTSFKIDRIKQVHDYLEGLEAVGKVQSLTNVLRLAEELNEGLEFDAFELAVINKVLPDEIKSSTMDPYISIANNEARINLRIVDSLPDLRRNQLLQQIRHDLEYKLGLDKQDFQISGMMVLYNNMLQSLFASQIGTLGVVLTGIALMLLILFRSLSLAIIGIIPNILAAATIPGLMGVLDIPLDMMTITITAITIGIAVDNSIHYIYRFREEYANTGDYIRTMHYCHANIGRAVFYTAITIIVGFSILMLSNFIPTIYFGVLTALAMFIALLAALTLLPKLILIWRPF
ncbi:MAG: efflux RND transporter permease subunit [Gammaproteobacteria bacterium]